MGSSDKASLLLQLQFLNASLLLMHSIGIAILVGEDSPPAPWLLLGFLLNWYSVLPEFSESRFNVILFHSMINGNYTSSAEQAH
jgi:hypothetical protein